MANGENPIPMPGSQPAYSALLVFNLGQLTAGINANMLANAVLTNNILVISGSSNQNLYEAILSNLQNSLQVQFTPNVQNTGTQSPTAAPGPKS